MVMASWVGIKRPYRAMIMLLGLQVFWSFLFDQVCMNCVDLSTLACRESKIETAERIQQAADIFDAHGDRIRAMISLNIKEQSAADDTFQNLFLSIVQTPVPPDTTRISSYIYRILANDIIDETRKSEVYNQCVRGYRQCGDYKTKQRDPEAEAIEIEETHRMFQSLRKHLPPHQAEAVIQNCILGNNTGDAAKKMNLNSRTFAKYLYKGKKKVRRLFGKKREKQGDRNEYIQK